MNNNLSKKEMEAFKYIRDAVIHGQKTPSLRDLTKLLNYSSPRSAMLITEKLTERGIIRRKDDGDWQILRDPNADLANAQTVKVPLVGSVACGTPILAEENIEAYIPVSTRLAKPGNKYYILRAQGDSMNKKGIDDGDFILVRSQQTADEGDLVVALINDSATVKELHATDNAIVLKPHSTNKDHQPIILHEDFTIQGVVQSVIKLS